MNEANEVFSLKNEVDPPFCLRQIAVLAQKGNMSGHGRSHQVPGSFKVEFWIIFGEKILVSDPSILVVLESLLGTAYSKLRLFEGFCIKGNEEFYPLNLKQSLSFCTLETLELCHNE